MLKIFKVIYVALTADLSVMWHELEIDGELYTAHTWIVPCRAHTWIVPCMLHRPCAVLSVSMLAMVGEIC